ncbi:uncharacterized protein EV422DRAFT_507086 [Fimicolochytrium jonesii]|uniref:uncharacterized protein n=1 Tax=Fimicolochytrium jonesii TaxID=1396493 RepID=UPI0022FDEF25|nr:uncharacterized protein EV422DRAFT_507086 [Fimicolochytrium jonesii]KAI8819903.1 hypothetical protein EV422DRAFT_507086 [Fimicolochytrium jonesii]
MSSELATRLLVKLDEMKSLILTRSSGWEAKVPQLRQLIASVQHMLCETSGVNTPLLQLQSMQQEIAKLKRTIEEFPDPFVKDKALRIVDHITTMSGQLFLGPSTEGRTPYMHAAYRPLDLAGLLRDVEPFLSATLKLAQQPYSRLPDIRLRRVEPPCATPEVTGQLLLYVELTEKICQQSEKIDLMLATHAEQSATREKEIALLQEQEQLATAKERAEKAECMNAVYDFISANERLLCKRFDVDCMTMNKALTTAAIAWSDLGNELSLPDGVDKDKQFQFVGMINKIKDERLEYGHASKAVAKGFLLSESLMSTAETHFSLNPAQMGILEKLLNWTLSQLCHGATLLELRYAAE